MNFLMKIPQHMQLNTTHTHLLNMYNINCSALRLLSSRPKPISSIQDTGMRSHNDSAEPRPKTFQEIYRFSNIKVGFAINKLKRLQSLLALLVLPTSAAMYYKETFDLDVLIGVTFSTVVFTGNMYGFGSLFHKAIGFMYVSEDGLTLKVSYLDFWGDRIDKEVAVDDVVPFSDCPQSPTDKLYRTVEFYSTKKLKLKLFFTLGGQITDEKKFVKVFGSLYNIE